MASQISLQTGIVLKGWLFASIFRSVLSCSGNCSAAGPLLKPDTVEDRPIAWSGRRARQGWRRRRGLPSSILATWSPGVTVTVVPRIHESPQDVTQEPAISILNGRDHDPDGRDLTVRRCVSRSVIDTMQGGSLLQGRAAPLVPSTIVAPAGVGAEMAVEGRAARARKAKLPAAMRAPHAVRPAAEPTPARALRSGQMRDVMRLGAYGPSEKQ